jgi:hypothetical protein
MKICKSCGAIQDNKRFNCIDCGERLGPPLSKEEERKANEKVSETINNLSNKADYFHVRKLDKAVASLLCIGVIISTALMIINRIYSIEIDMNYAIVIVIIFMLWEAVDLLFPRISWVLYKLRFVFRIENVDDLIPTDFALFIRRVFAYAVLVLGYAFLFYIAWYFSNSFR